MDRKISTELILDKQTDLSLPMAPEDLSLPMAPEDLSLPMEHEDLSLPMEHEDLFLPIAHEDLAEAVAYRSDLPRSVSFIDYTKKPEVTYPACIEFESHGVCPVNMGCVGPDSKTSALPTRITWPLPLGKRLRVWKVVTIGNVSMNNTEKVRTISRLFFEYATNKDNIRYSPEEYEENVVNFQAKIQRVLLDNTRIDDLETQINQKMKIIEKYNTTPDDRASAIETFRDLVNYAELLLIDYDFIASYQVFDGDIPGLNEVPLKIYSRGKAEHDATNPNKPDTDWTISWFEGSPILTYSKPNAPGFKAKKNHERKRCWNPKIANQESTNEEICNLFFEEKYSVLDILDNTCETPTDYIENFEIERKILLDRMRREERKLFREQSALRAEYAKQKHKIYTDWHTSSKSRKDFNDFMKNKQKALEDFKKNKEAIKLFINKKNKLIPKINALRDRVKHKCIELGLPHPDPEGGKKTRRIGFKMTVKKGIGSTLKKTRNKKMKRLKKGRKTKKRFYTIGHLK